jgi:hypothetical protein
VLYLPMKEEREEKDESIKGSKNNRRSVSQKTNV